MVAGISCLRYYPVWLGVAMFGVFGYLDGIAWDLSGAGVGDSGTGVLLSVFGVIGSL